MTPYARQLLQDRIQGKRLGKEHDLPLIETNAEMNWFERMLEVEGTLTAALKKAVDNRRAQITRGFNGRR